MKRNKHLLLWSSVTVLALLVLAASEENFGKEWRRLQRRASADLATAKMPTRLRQVVIPAVPLTDRCISCHVGMAPGESGVAGDPVLAPHAAVVHDPADFGCTLCHGGQGRATEKDDAHGTVHFWPEPMIPAQYAQAGCGTCHTFGPVPDHRTLTQGLLLLERLDCLSCHALDGRGGTLRPAGAAAVIGPDLSRVGATGYRRDWYAGHLAERDRAQEGAWKTSMAPIDPSDLVAIEAALDTRVGAPRLVEAKALFYSRGCLGCHKVEGVGGDDGPDLTRVGRRDPGQTDFSHVPQGRSIAAWFAEHFRNPARVVPGSLMPGLGLSEDEIDLLTLYMLSLRRADLPPSYWPDDRLRSVRLGESEFARDPATLFGALCAACHGPEGQGMRYAGMAAFPAIGSRGFLEVADDEFIAETIRSGRPGRRMPAWGGGSGMLGDAEIDALVKYLRSVGGVDQPEPQRRLPVDGVDVAQGTQLYASACASCHGAQGEGLEGPALSNPVFLRTASDFYVAETIRRGRPGTSMEAFGQPSIVRPMLSDEEIASVVAHIRSWEVSP